MAKIREFQSDDSAKPDMTPMIDCTFLLICFLVTVQQLSVMEVATQVTLPRAKMANPESTEDKDRLIISVDSNGTTWVSNMRLNEEKLAEIIKDEAGPDGVNTDWRDAEGYAKRTVFIRADVTAPYGVVQDIMTLCRDQKIFKLAFRVKEWKEQQP